jgi:hypothetical protein
MGQDRLIFRGFTITLRHTTLGRTPLDEWPARRRDLYLTTYNTHNRQTSMPPVGCEPTIPVSERPQTHALDRAASGNRQFTDFTLPISSHGRSQWPRGLRRGSSAAHLLGLWVRIPHRAWMSVCCECCVLSGRGLCDGLVTRPEESYRLWCVSNVCDREASIIRRPRPPRGCRAIGKKFPHASQSEFKLF